MIFKVIIHDQAMDDIVRNAKWWAERYSQSKALEWYDAIIKRIESLQEMPESNPLVPENDLFKRDIHHALFGLGPRPGYRIIFTVKENNVHVLTVKAAEERWLGSGDLDLIGP